MIKGRDARKDDIKAIVALDRKAYGKFGGNKGYFLKKLGSQKIIVAEQNKRIVGFAVLEFITGKKLPNNFSNLQLTIKLPDKWINIPEFTTATNYADKKIESALLGKSENIAKKEGCRYSCVPLTEIHPFEGVFRFWKENGYKKAGTLYWKSNIKTEVKCLFFESVIR